MDIVWIIVTLIIGLAAGALLAYAIVTRRYGDRESVTELRNEFDEYQERVTKHFVETADLVNTLTRSYKNVYDHLEKGAYELVGKETLNKQLGTIDEEPVMIEYIGQRRSLEDGETGVGSASAPKGASGPSISKERDHKQTTGAVGSGGKLEGHSDEKPGSAGKSAAGPSLDASKRTDDNASEAEDRTRSAG